MEVSTDLTPFVELGEIVKIHDDPVYFRRRMLKWSQQLNLMQKLMILGTGDKRQRELFGDGYRYIESRDNFGIIQAEVLHDMSQHELALLMMRLPHDNPHYFYAQCRLERRAFNASAK